MASSSDHHARCPVSGKQLRAIASLLISVRRKKKKRGSPLDLLGTPTTAVTVANNFWGGKFSTSKKQNGFCASPGRQETEMQASSTAAHSRTAAQPRATSVGRRRRGEGSTAERGYIDAKPGRGGGGGHGTSFILFPSFFCSNSNSKQQET